jgi:hypothetical protein
MMHLYGQLAGRVRKSYTAKGWSAQLRELTSTAPGRAAADQAGLSVTARTLLAWLSEERTPTKANRAKIADAYQSMRGGFNRPAVMTDIHLTGQVTFYSPSEKDRRMRGVGGSAPLLIDGKHGNWDRTEDWWNRNVLFNDVAETFFIEDVIEPDIGEVSDGAWGAAFDGSWYEVRV